MASRPISNDDVITTARLYGVPPALALAIWGQESGEGRNTKTSPKGAVGGFQVIPDTFRRYMPEGQINNPTDNMVAGIKVLQDGLQKSGGDPEGAAQFYYHGRTLPPGVEGPDSGPGTPTTRRYGKEVVARMNNILADMGPERGGNIQVASAMPSLYGDDAEVAGEEINDEDVDEQPIPNLGMYAGNEQDQPIEESIPDIAGLTRPLDNGNTDWLQSMGSSQDFELDKYVRSLVDEEFANG